MNQASSLIDAIMLLFFAILLVPVASLFSNGNAKTRNVTPKTRTEAKPAAAQTRKPTAPQPKKAAPAAVPKSQLADDHIPNCRTEQSQASCNNAGCFWCGGLATPTTAECVAKKELCDTPHEAYCHAQKDKVFCTSAVSFGRGGDDDDGCLWCPSNFDSDDSFPATCESDESGCFTKRCREKNTMEDCILDGSHPCYWCPIAIYNAPPVCEFDIETCYSQAWVV